jgi:hypothetical protein
LLSVLLIVGIVLMAARRRDHGRAAVMGILGCVVLLLGVVFNVARGLLDEALAELLSIAVAFTVSSVISMIFSLTGTALLIAAVVARRNPAQAAPPAGQGWPRQPQQPEWGQPQQPEWGRPQQPQQPEWQPQQPPQPGWQPQQPPFEQQPGWQNPPHPQNPQNPPHPPHPQNPPQG